MNQLLSPQLLKYRARYLFAIRSFFQTNGFLEIDTPSLKSTAGMEPYLDPMLVSSPHMEKEGYLITSPEYSLKQTLSLGIEKIYEIAHCFRSGEKGVLHTKEFLMLEFYQVGIDEMGLMDVCISLFDYLQINFEDFGFQKENCIKVKMEDLFLEKTRRSFSLEDLIITLREKFPEAKYDYDSMYYEDLFFLVFLNFIENELPKNRPVFIYDYPEELAALAKVENGRAKRFEIYWNGVELGNAFFELTAPEIQINRFKKEQVKRLEIGKEAFDLDLNFIDSLKRGLPTCSGIAIGLDRLLMIILKLENLKQISPYYINA
ncbi:MAG: elongation factor P--(R)-beta-lysine ligase [Leptospiraceae bacterium]|nr:elongation factor P--(R)-beta-lysine ligase [Leptospiraceae bacterium]